MLFLPESPRFLMHKGKELDAFKVWKRIRGVGDADAREEFYLMKASVTHEETAVNEGASNRRFPWMDFFTCVLPVGALLWTESSRSHANGI